MLNDDHVKGAAQVGSTEAVGEWCEGRMLMEELLLSSECVLDRLMLKDVFLGATDNSNVAKFKRVNFALNDGNTVLAGALIHQINLGENADSAFTLRIDSSGKL